jgi:hypothetical protein
MLNHINQSIRSAVFYLRSDGEYFAVQFGTAPIQLLNVLYYSMYHIECKVLFLYSYGFSLRILNLLSWYANFISD